MALAARVQNRDFRVYCMLGDGELSEGQIWEAVMSANQFKLQGLVAIIDRNLPAIILALAAVAVVVAALLTPKFLSIDNLTAILRNAAIVGLVAVAMTPITLSGNFVSLGISQSAMACMVAFVWLLGAGWPQPLAMLVVRPLCQKPPSPMTATVRCFASAPKAEAPAQPRP